MLRFATRPDEEMRITDLREALLNYLAARRRGERFVVRFERGGDARGAENRERETLEILQLCGVRYDDVTYERDNLTIHQHMAIKLLGERKAFACFCPPEELEAEREAARRENRPYRYGGRCERLSDAEVIDNEKPFTVRIRKPDRPVEFDDLVAGRRRFAPDEVDSFVILRTDKSPTPDFAAAVDDMLQDITLVIRGEERLEEAPRQIHVRERLGYDKRVEYAHLPPLLDEEGEPIGQEGADFRVRRFLEEGFLPEAIANYLVLLSTGAPEEPFTLEEAAEGFDPRTLSKSPAAFDIETRRRLNREWMRRMDPLELSRAFGFADAAVGEVAKRFLDRGCTIAEIRPYIEALFAPKPFGGPRGETMRRLRDAIRKAPLFERYDELEAYLKEETGLEGEALAEPLRLLLTGSEEGPELSELYPYLKSYLQEIVQ